MKPVSAVPGLVVAVVLLGACGEPIEPTPDAGRDASPDRRPAGECTADETRCGGVCADTRTSTLHCGTCGRACAVGQACEAGRCTGDASCPAGQVDCGGGACVDTTSSPTHCGMCGRACGATETCTGGACTATAMCPAGRSNCQGTCSNVLLDPSNCGVCGRVCSPGETCAMGSCRVAMTCPVAGQSDCGGACTDTTANAQHCGRCGRECRAGETCAGGACVPATCAAGQMRCGAGVCVDTMTDAANCGACGRACAAGQACVAGACGAACPAPRTTCMAPSGAGVCVDTMTDAAHCGACGRACPEGRACVGGGCACGAGRVECAGTCTDTQTDERNCGACGAACGAGQSCAAGRCACPAGQTACGAACVSTQTDERNCGACGRACAAGQSCNAGTCSSLCMAGLSFCGGMCVNPQSDPANCGACGARCAAGAVCAAGACRPVNDDRASAALVTLTLGERVITGSTAGATRDGPSVGCVCTITSGNVWYRFALATRELVYLDTAGSGYDTSLFLTDAAGNPLPAQPGAGSPSPGLCNDDAGCAAGGFTATNQSRTQGVLDAGTYYVAVGGCGTGSFTLRIQHIPVNAARVFVPARLVGTGTASGTLSGASAASSVCGGAASGEDMRWFVTCGGQPQFFSLCRSDGGYWGRPVFGADYDAVLALRSGQTGGVAVCNDDGGTMGGTDCRGTLVGIAGGSGLGSRLNNVTAPRGINVVLVDERARGEGMAYTLAYTVR